MLCVVHLYSRSAFMHNVKQPWLWSLQPIYTLYTLHIVPMALVQYDQSEGTLHSGGKLSCLASFPVFCLCYMSVDFSMRGCTGGAGGAVRIWALRLLLCHFTACHFSVNQTFVLRVWKSLGFAFTAVDHSKGGKNRSLKRENRGLSIHGKVE